MERSKPIRICVVYALPDKQVLIELEVEEGTTVAQAVERSRLPQQFPEISSTPLACAIYGRTVVPTSVVNAGDRIEILRPLLIDPKESRRQAAARSRSAATARKQPRE